MRNWPRQAMGCSTKNERPGCEAPALLNPRRPAADGFVPKKGYHMQQDKKKVEYTLKVVTDGTVDPFTLTTPLITTGIPEADITTGRARERNAKATTKKEKESK